MSRNNDRRNARRQNNGSWQRASSTNKVAAKATTMTGGEDPTQLTAVESFLRKGSSNRLSDTSSACSLGELQSWILEEITTKAAAIAIVVEGRYLTVTDMRACNAYASACHAQLRLVGDPHGGYYDGVTEDGGRVWHPHVKAPAQATYGLGVGATTVVGPGGSRSRWASGSAPGAVSPGQTGSTDPNAGARAGGTSLVQ